MDFRSQLSAFKNNSGGGGGGAGRSQNNNRSSNNDNNTRGYGSGGNHYGRRDDGRRDDGRRDDGRRDDGRRDDRRRHRPNNWNHHHNQGPPQSRRRYHSPDRDGLGDLRRFGFNITKGNPPLPTLQEKKKKTKHIALLAITIDDLPYEHIWKAWLQTINVPAGKKDGFYVSLVCHAKYPDQVKSDWLRQRLLVQRPRLGRGNSYLDPEFLTRKPEWGSIEITRAMLDLLQDAAKIGNDDQKDMRFAASRFLARKPVIPIEEDTGDEEVIPSVDQFLFISETCLPVVTALEFFGKAKDTTVSWVNGRHRKDEGTPKNKYEDDQFAGISRRIAGQFRWKADQWVLLCRNHANQILNMDRPHMQPRHQLWQNFRNINASDEMYFPTVLAMLGLLRYTADGDDTQRIRNGDDQRARSGSQDDGKGPGRGRSNSADIKSPKKDQAADGTPKEAVHLVLKRPVTYTDWTEGMRNPASFAKGISDFKRVARLARDKGCLVARKFAPFIAVPGVAKEDQKVTGQITAEEWRQEVEIMKKRDDELNPPKQEEEDEEEGEEEEGKASEATDGTDAVGNEDQESKSERNQKVLTPVPNKVTKDEEGEEEDDDDDDQQENELE